MIARSSRRDLDIIGGVAGGKRDERPGAEDRMEGAASRNGRDRWRDLVRVNKRRWGVNTPVPDASHGEKPIQPARQDCG
jgi:hypothetical protein